MLFKPFKQFFTPSVINLTNARHSTQDPRHERLKQQALPNANRDIYHINKNRVVRKHHFSI